MQSIEALCSDLGQSGPAFFDNAICKRARDRGAATLYIHTVVRME